MTTLAAVADAPPAFEVIDALGGFASLVKRSPTLDGSVPLRVAKACVPLLEGNAWGMQVRLARRIELRKRFGTWSVATADEDFVRACSARLALWLASGLVERGGYWHRRLERGLVSTKGGISIVTGLFVRPREGTRVRLSSTANRRSWAYAIDEAIYAASERALPVILDVVPAAHVDHLVLDGEVATLAALPARVTFEQLALDAAPDVGRAHVAFYDAHYFATKKRGEIAHAYRDRMPRDGHAATRTDRDRMPRDEHGAATTRSHRTPRDESAARSTAASLAGSADGDPAPVRLVTAGPTCVAPAAPPRVFGAAGPVNDGEPDRLVVRNPVALTADYDGLHVTVTPDADQLDAFAAAVRAPWQRWLAAEGIDAHHGALLYLTKYITPHPPGEPHFFVKPPAFVATPPGVSTLIEGTCGAGYDVLRGVVRTDGFHALPAVFQLWQPGREIALRRDAVLAELFPCPRAVADAPIAHTRLP